MKNNIEEMEGVTVTEGGRHSYTQDAKQKIIDRLKGGEAASAVGAELNINPSQLRRWVRDGAGKNKPATGFITLKGGRKIYSDAYKREVAQRFANGETTIALAKELGLTSSMVSAWHRIFIKGVEISHAGKTPTKKPGGKDKQTYTALFKTVALKRVRAGESAKDVAASLGISAANVYNWVADYKKQRADAGRKGGLTKGKNNRAAAPTEDAPALAARMRDAVSLLKHAKAAMYASLQNGQIKEFDEQHLLVLQALRTLTGGE